MTQRTRNHILEDESRYEFRRALPAVWVCRDKQGDYGIDCEVEIFTEEGYATGLVFWVQLKATDVIDHSAAKKLYFQRDKIEQFLSYDIPVLVVRYASKSKALYLRWVKGLPVPERQGKSIAIFFPESSRWTEESASSIDSYLKAQNFVKQGRVNLPIPAAIDRTLDVEASAIPYTYVNIVKTCLRDYTGYINILRDRREAVLFIRVSESKMFMSLADIHGAEMKVTFEKVTSEHIPELTKHTLVLFCSLMFDFGRKEIANHIIIKEELLPVIFKSQEYLISILPELLETERFEDVLQALETYLRSDHDGRMDAQVILKILLTDRRTALSQKKMKSIGRFYENELDFHMSHGNSMNIAHAHYNIAQHRKALGETKEAIWHYLQARKYGQFYEKAHYYFSDLGGLLFSLDKFRLAAGFYGKAIELGSNDPVIKALRADALMYAGYYGEARDQFDDYLLTNVEDPDNDEWQLKYSTLASMLVAGYPATQRRNPELADEFANQGRYDEAIEKDFLHRGAWYGLGIDSVKSGNYLNAFTALMFSALLFRDDPYVWAISLLTGLDAKVNLSLIVFLVRVAHECTGQAFASEVQRIFSKTNPENVDHILELIDQMIKDVKRKPIKVRLFSANGAFNEFQV